MFLPARPVAMLRDRLRELLGEKIEARRITPRYDVTLDG